MTQKNKSRRDDTDFSALPQQENEIEDFGPVISVYTRQQAIKDGVLIDATPYARMLSIPFHVVLTSAAWTACIDGDHVAEPTSEELRLLNVMRVLLRAASHNYDGDIYLKVNVPVLTIHERLESVALRAVLAPGHDGQAFITVMLPGED